MHVNKVENRITFKIKTGYYLELLTLEIHRYVKSMSKFKTKNLIENKWSIKRSVNTNSDIY